MAMHVVDAGETLSSTLASRAAATPKEVAFRFLDRASSEASSLTYAELHGRASARAREFEASGLAGTRIVFGHETGPGFVVDFFAAMAVGAAVVPISTRVLLRPSPALDALLAAARPSAVLLDPEVAARRPLPHLEGPFPPACAAWRGFAAPDDVAVVQFTSGSTSTPKGVAITHGNFLANAAAISRAHDMKGATDEVVVSWLPLFHDMGLMLGVVWPIASGSTAILMEPSTFVSRPTAWLAAISRYRATVSSAPNFGYQTCVDHVGDAELAGLDLSSWRVAICGAEPIRPETVDGFVERFGSVGLRPRTLAPAYGLAEATVFVSGGCPPGARSRIEPLDVEAMARGDVLRADPGRQVEPRRVVSCGPVADNVHVAVVDPDGAVDLGDGKVGEIWVSGPSVAAGYFEAPEATALAFGARLPGTDSAYLRTGDLGFLLDGELFVCGRLKDLIVVRGTKHHPHDVEATVRACDPLLAGADCAAFADHEGDQVVVVVEVASGSDEAALADSVRAAVSAAHGLRLDAVAFVGRLRLPRTTSGKIRRREAAAQWDGGTANARAFFADDAAAAPDLAPASTLDRVLDAWRSALGTRGVDADANFFEMGGDSVRLAAALARLKATSDAELNLADLFEHPNPRALAAFLDGGGKAKGVGEAQSRGRRRREALGQAAEDGVAVVGMAVRFPGAPDVASFWANVSEGRVSISRSGEPEGDENLVRACATLDGADLFDADFFGLSGAEASAMDPQQRVLLECAHRALEAAGCDPARSGPVGVFVGSGMNPYRLSLLGPDLADADVSGRWLTILGNDKDYLASRLAYKLGLRGPSLTVQTACSTSLVAVHLACQSLLSGECDVALAGGATVANSLDPRGYRAEAGDVRSTDGRCRPFDAEAKGTVFGDGAGVVALKRLSDALADGDHVHAVVAGSATNNDGADRVGYGAPGIAGQAAVVAEAIAAAGVDADRIGYVEAHGTGTVVGDPVEVTALTRAFRGSTDARGFCALGSVKANVGHASAAAGIAGFVKAVLALENGAIPPNPELGAPNPAIDFAGSPFVATAEGAPWPRGEAPRFAGVSSFGMGGVNAHAVLREAPLRDEVSAEAREELMFVSARDARALESLADAVSRRLASARVPAVADAAFTLAAGRKAWPHRRAVVASSPEAVVEALSGRDRRRVADGVASGAAPNVVFAFPGSGSQRLGMGAAAYRREPAYRDAFDECADAFRPLLGLDLRDLLFKGVAPDGADPAATLARASVAQPAQFAVSVALAALWERWGIRPAAMVGHSFGEIVAAHLAGVFTLGDAARLVARRGELVDGTPAGAMLAVLSPAGEFEELLGADVAMACRNGPAAFSVAGTPEAVAALDAELAAGGILSRPIRTDRAYHSPLMRGAVAPYVEFVATLRRRPPKVPFVSTVTGEWIKRSEAMDPAHWGRQLIEPVLFSRAMETLKKAGAATFLEVGPGRALSALVGQNLPNATCVASLGQAGDEEVSLLRAAGALWASGCGLDAGAFAAPGARKADMPPHPMERKRYLLAADRDRSYAPRKSPPATPEKDASPLGATDALTTASVDPRTFGVLEAVALAWGECLGLPVGPDDDFFELGGHSLMAAGAANRLSNTLHLRVGAADVFRHRTPRRMAEFLEGTTAEATA